MHIGTDTPAADTLEDAEGFGVQSVGMTDDTVKGIGGGGFEIVGSSKRGC
jgi:hypothetical protein